MKIIIEKKYLVVPINSTAVSKRLCLFDEEGTERTLLIDYLCKIDLLHPSMMIYIDVSRYLGRTVSYECIPHMEPVLRQADRRELPELYREEHRPHSHFTPALGWINDPNGMIRHRGVYHAFYQYNPCDVVWNNMHWGHAVSRDLIHWEEQEIALFPDEMGTMFSGSAIEDTRNVSGLQTGELPPMLLFYTAAGNKSLLSKGKAFTQCLAYSNDGGKTFQKYEKNPILPWIVHENRDPKVVWAEELGCYLMGLYLTENRFGLFTSRNLLDWEPLQEIEMPGEAECPDLYCFRTEGRSYWVLIGASDKYVVGRFENGRFLPVCDVQQLGFSPHSYAAQSFSGIDDGRVLRMTWQRLRMPCERVPNQLSLPMEMQLHANGNDLFLTAAPAREIERLYEAEQSLEELSLSEPLTLPLDPAAYDLQITADDGQSMQLELFGHTLQIHAQEGVLAFGKLRVPLSKDRESLELRIIVDSCSFGVFTDGGRFYATLYAVCDYNLPYLRLSSNGNARIRSLSCRKLASIHK